MAQVVQDRESTEAGATSVSSVATAEPEGIDVVGQSAARAAAALIVEDASDVPPGAETRSEFLDLLKRDLEAMVDAAITTPEWSAADCPWINQYIEHFRTRDLDELRRFGALYARGVPPGGGPSALRRAVVDRARDGVESWKRTGAVPRLPPGLPPPAGLDAAPLAGLLRKADGSATTANEPPAALHARLGPGRTLPPSDRPWLEERFGVDLGHVRFHDDPPHRSIAARAGARAFALGDHVVFRDAAAGLRELSRRALLAHEVAHVVQERDAAVAPGTRSGATAPDIEHDADVAAGTALLGGTARPRKRLGSALDLHGCGGPGPMNDEELAEYLATQHLRVVVVQQTNRFLSGMKKSFAVAANEDPSVDAPNLVDGDELITGFSGGGPRLTHVVFDVPMSGGKRMPAPTTVHRQSGTWPLSLAFPGLYVITASVMINPGVFVEVTRRIDVAPADFDRESNAQGTKDLAGLPARTPAQEKVALRVRRAELRARAVAAGALGKDANEAWTALTSAVLARVGAIQERTPLAGTGTAISDSIETMLRVATPMTDDLRAALAQLRRKAFESDHASLVSALDQVVQRFDSWVIARIQASGKDPDLVTGLKQIDQTERRLDQISALSKSTPTRLPAVFHPRAAYVRRELFVAPPISLGEIVSVPLNLWLYQTAENTWTLLDISDPTEEKPFTASERGTTRAAAIEQLLKKLVADKNENFPDGRLHVQPPDGPAQQFAIEGDMDLADWLGVMALILAAAGIIVMTAGSATPGVVAVGGYLLTASAVAGAAAAVADTVDAAQRGRLTKKRLLINSLQFVASVASAGTSRILTSAARAGSLAAIGSNSRYILLNRAAAGADVAQIAVMTVDTVGQLASLGKSKGKDDQAALRAALALGQLLAQGAITIVSVRDAAKVPELDAHPAIDLHGTAAGDLVIRPMGSKLDDVVPTGPRRPSDLLSEGGATFSADHAPLRDAYADYRARKQKAGETPLEPLDWVKHQTQGAPSEYLKSTLPDGWRDSLRTDYPGARPEMIDRPSSSPVEGSIDPNTTGRWRYRRVLVDDLKQEVDNVGDPYWSFPDLQDHEVLVLPSGTRVWRHPVTKAIIEEHPVGPSVTAARSRTQGEATIPSAGEMGGRHEKAGVERAHGAASPGLGFDSPYSVARAPKAVNQVLENNGIELYLRRLRDNAPEGVTYVSTTITKMSGQDLAERVYRIDAIDGGALHNMYEFRIALEGGIDNASVRFLADEVQVFAGAGTYGAPSVKGHAPSAPQSVEVPQALSGAMGRAATGADKIPTSKVTPALFQSKKMRERLDDLMKDQVQRKTMSTPWLDAHEQAVEQLVEAERRIASMAVHDTTRERFRETLTSYARTWGRSPAKATTSSLIEFTAAVKALIE